MRDIIVKSDSTIVLVGSTRTARFSKNITAKRYVPDAKVAAISSNGELLWQYEFGSRLIDRFHSVAEAHDGSLVIVGSTYDDGNSSQGWIVSLNGNGKVLWELKIDEDKWQPLMDIVTGGNNDLFVVGRLVTANPNRKQGASFTKLNPAGEILFRKKFFDSQFSGFQQVFRSDENMLVALIDTRRDSPYPTGAFVRLDETGEEKSVIQAPKISIFTDALDHKAEMTSAGLAVVTHSYFPIAPVGKVIVSLIGVDGETVWQQAIEDHEKQRSIDISSWRNKIFVLLSSSVARSDSDPPRPLRSRLQLVCMSTDGELLERRSLFENAAVTSGALAVDQKGLVIVAAAKEAEGGGDFDVLLERTTCG